MDGDLFVDPLGRARGDVHNSQPNKPRNNLVGLRSGHGDSNHCGGWVWRIAQSGIFLLY